jgi:excisionase family DNA binding protein
MPWVSMREASEMLKVSLRTVQRLVAAHTLSSRMEHGRRLVLIGADEDRARATSEPGLTPALLPHVFDLLEGFTRLWLMAGRAVEEAKADEPLRAFPMWDAPSMARWQKLYDQIVTCHHLVSGLVAKLQLDRQVVHQVYRELIMIQLFWADYEARSGEEEPTPTDQTKESDPQTLITRLIGHARALLTGCVHSRGTPGVQPVSGDGVIGVDGGSDAATDRGGGGGGSSGEDTGH